MTETNAGSNEQKQVLEMLAEGKISVDDAHRLLDKLKEVGDSQAKAGQARAPRSGGAKYLRIQTTGEDESDQINLRIPLGMARAGIGLSSILPDWVQRHVVIGGIDLTKELDLTSDELLETLDELDISVDAASGETVRIFCE